MLTHLPASPWLAFAIALAPAVLRLVWGRPLVRLIDDPVLPERLAANHRRNTQAVAAAFAILVVGFPTMAKWTLPLLIIARGIAAYPLRKQLYAETWGLGAYLAFFSRLIVAMFGFWILLAMMPTFALAEGNRGWMLSAVLALVLVAWNARSAQVLRALLRVRPVTDAALLPRFEAMVRTAGLPATRFDYIDMKGGVLANAVAVPSLTSQGVIFTDTLLARLDADEILAICGHELAHLEHYNRGRLRRLNAANLTLIAVGAALGPLTRVYLPGASAAAAGGVWPVLLVMSLIWRARDRQRNETASDARAVQLSGNAEALASALTKLYAFARIPRRWDRERERQATHPSLARRLRDIQAAAGAARTRTLEEAAAFASGDGAVTVTFDRTHVSWQEGDVATHRFSYGHLTELRLDARPTGTARLVAVESTGRRWEMALAAADVQRAQDVLDLVDGGLAHPAPAPRVSPSAGRVVAAIAAVLACTAGQFSVVLVAALAALRPGTQLLAAASLAGLMASALAMRDATWIVSVWLVLPLVLVAATMGWIAWSQRDDTQTAPRRLVAAMAVFSAVGCLLLLGDGFNAVRVHQAAKTVYLGPVMLLAFAGALALARTPRARPAALAAAAFSAAIAVIGSPFFLQWFGRDPFLVHAKPIAFASRSRAPLTQVEVPLRVDELRVSPHGTAIAVTRSEDDDQAEEVATFHVGPAAGPLTPVKADDVAFLDETRLITMTTAANGADIREVRLGRADAESWCAHIDALTWGTLSVDAARGTWRVLGWDRARQILSAQGRIGDSAVSVTRWDGFGAKQTWITAMAATDTTLVALENSYDRAFFLDSASTWSVALSMVLPMSMRKEARFWRVTKDGATLMAETALDPECIAAADARALVCTAYDGVTTRVLKIDPATGGIDPIARVDGRFIARDSTSPGSVSGFLSSSPAVLRVDTGTGVRAIGPARATTIAAGADAIATASYSRDGSIVSVYRF